MTRGMVKDYLLYNTWVSESLCSLYQVGLWSNWCESQDLLRKYKLIKDYMIVCDEILIWLMKMHCHNIHTGQDQAKVLVQYSKQKITKYNITIQHVSETNTILTIFSHYSIYYVIIVSSKRWIFISQGRSSNHKDVMIVMAVLSLWVYI